MYAIEKSSYTEAWETIGRAFPRPKAIVMISAHWYIPYCAVTANIQPRTIHDFGGFPKPLYAVQYPAPGSPELAQRVQALLAPNSVSLDEEWGLDHGTWAVLRHVYPDADIPVIQLSIDRNQPPAFHYQMGKRLAALREDGILVAGSGNIVHNLSAYAWGQENVVPYDWALRFEDHVRQALVRGDDDAVVDYLSFGRDAVLSAPTPEHYLPLLYVLGLRREEDPISFPVQGMDGGSISMLAVQFG